MSRSLGSLGQPALLLLTTLLRPSLFPLPMERRLLTAPRGVPTLGSAFTLLLPRGLGLKAALLRDGLSSGLPRIGLWRLFLNGLRLVASAILMVFNGLALTSGISGPGLRMVRALLVFRQA